MSLIIKYLFFQFVLSRSRSQQVFQTNRALKMNGLSSDRLTGTMVFIGAKRAAVTSLVRKPIAELMHFPNLKLKLYRTTF